MTDHCLLLKILSFLGIQNTIFSLFFLANPSWPLQLSSSSSPKQTSTGWSVAGLFLTLTLTLTLYLFSILPIHMTLNATIGAPG